MALPPEAVTAAAEAIEDEAIRHIGRDLGTLHRDDIVAAGLAAALPLIEQPWRDLAADVVRHLDVEHRQWGSDRLGEGIQCGGCALLVNRLIAHTASRTPQP